MAIKLEINMTNKWLYSLIAVGILLALGVGVCAYQSDMRAGNPLVMGHSAGEINVENSAGQVVSLQELIDSGGVGNGNVLSITDWKDVTSSRAYGVWYYTDNQNSAVMVHVDMGQPSDSSRFTVLFKDREGKELTYWDMANYKYAQDVSVFFVVPAGYQYKLFRSGIYGSYSNNWFESIP